MKLALEAVDKAYDELARAIRDKTSYGDAYVELGMAHHYLKQAIAEVKQEQGEPVAIPRFDCWSTNDGDSWFEHPADSQAIYDMLGDDPKVGDEFELTAGWTCVTAKYRVTEVNVDGDCEVECISHPHENTTPQQRKPLTDEQIDQIADTVANMPLVGIVHDFRSRFARAIEAAHGIKE